MGVFFGFGVGDTIVMMFVVATLKATTNMWVWNAFMKMFKSSIRKIKVLGLIESV